MDVYDQEGKWTCLVEIESFDHGIILVAMQGPNPGEHSGATEEVQCTYDGSRRVIFIAIPEVACGSNLGSVQPLANTVHEAVVSSAAAGFEEVLALLTRIWCRCYFTVLEGTCQIVLAGDGSF
jgi:hypothetical protein